MGISISSLETLAQKVGKYTKACGVKSILQTKPPSLKSLNIEGLKIKPLTEDVLVKSENIIATSKIGKHKVPRFLYHLTTKENYLSILKDGKLRIGTDLETVPGVNMFEMSNLLKHWKPNKDYSYLDLRNMLLLQALKAEEGTAVLIRIPTESLDKTKLLIRSQKKLFNGGSLTDVEPAIKSKLFKQKKEAIEYIYPQEIDISKVKKISEASIDTTRPLKENYSKLLQNTPEEKNLVFLG